MWYYTLYVDLITGTEDEFYADYYNAYDDGEGYSSTVYASPDWSYYWGESTYETDAGYQLYVFNSDTGIDETYLETADGLYNSYYDAISGTFLEYVYTAPTDYYLSEVSEDGTTYTYKFVDADNCYSYSGVVINTEDLQKVYINDNGHETLYEADPSGCWNQYYDQTYDEYSMYWDHIDETTYDEDGTYYNLWYDACTDDYYMLYTTHHGDGMYEKLESDTYEDCV